MEKNSKKACMLEHCQWGRENTPWRIWTTHSSGSFVVWTYTSCVAAKSWGREVSGLGLVVPSMTGQSKGQPSLENLTFSPGGQDCVDINWKMHPESRDPEHRGERQLCALELVEYVGRWQYQG